MTTKTFRHNDGDLAIAYYRCSTPSQVETPVAEASIGQQRDAAHKYAEEHGLTIIREYEDRAISGTTSERPGYQQMLSEVGRLRPAVRILWKADRLGRDVAELARAMQAIKDAGCRVCYVGGTVPDDDSPEAGLMESMLDGMAGGTRY